MAVFRVRLGSLGSLGPRANRLLASRRLASPGVALHRVCCYRQATAIQSIPHTVPASITQALPESSAAFWSATTLKNGYLQRCSPAVTRLYPSSEAEGHSERGRAKTDGRHAGPPHARSATSVRAARADLLSRTANKEVCPIMQHDRYGPLSLAECRSAVAARARRAGPRRVEQGAAGRCGGRSRRGGAGLATARRGGGRGQGRMWPGRQARQAASPD